MQLTIISTWNDSFSVCTESVAVSKCTIHDMIEVPAKNLHKLQFTKYFYTYVRTESVAICKCTIHDLIKYLQRIYINYILSNNVSCFKTYFQ